MDDPGFLFYVSYHLKDASNKVDYAEIKYGKSLEITYRDSDLPIVLLTISV